MIISKAGLTRLSRTLVPAVPTAPVGRLHARPSVICKGAKQSAPRISRPHAGHSSDLIFKLRAAKVQKYLDAGWRSDVDMRSNMNVMTWLLMITLGAPMLGLAFAMATFGQVWGLGPVV